MCGIAGQIGYDQGLRTQTETITKMQAALRRRGPDQEGLFLAPHAQLAHTRLCVIDPVNGRQPMTARREGRTCTLVYNGELYNTEDLRRELAAAGWGFSGHSDTEVLLKSYLEWGEDCVERFNGIFAFPSGRRRRRRCSWPGTAWASSPCSSPCRPGAGWCSPRNSKPC